MSIMSVATDWLLGSQSYSLTRRAVNLATTTLETAQTGPHAAKETPIQAETNWLMRVIKAHNIPLIYYRDC